MSWNAFFKRNKTMAGGLAVFVIAVITAFILKPFIDEASSKAMFWALAITALIYTLYAVLFLYHLMSDLSALGRKLEADGKITVENDDNYARLALDYVMAENGQKVLPRKYNN